MDSSSPPSSAPRGTLSALWSALALRHDPRRSRLDALIDETGAAIDRAALRTLDASSQALVGRCRASLEDVRAARDDDAYFRAYGLLKTIRRELVELMPGPERRVALQLLIAEARSSKLNAWRQDAAGRITALVGDDGVPEPALLQGLMANIDEAQQNRQHKLELVQRQVLWLCLLMLAAVLGIAVLAARGPLDWIYSDASLPRLGLLLPTAIATGFLGGLLSLAYGLTRLETRSSIQDMRSSLATTLARPLIGAAVAVPILLFLRSGLIAAELVTPVLALSLCFVGGFSERWFLAQVDRIASK